MSEHLNIDVFLSGYKPIPSQVPAWPAGVQATWPATTSTLVSGASEALLVDALMTIEESQGLAEWVSASGKDLRTVYITHAHADHFFGLGSIRETFPEVAAVTLDALVPALAEQTSAGYLAVWNSFFPGQMFDAPEVPRALGGDIIMVEGHAVHILDVGQSDVPESSILHIPESAVVIAGDVVYNNMHMWLSGSDHDSRLRWISAIDAVEGLQPKTIITGHKDPAARDDDASRLLDTSRDYLLAFDEAVADCDSDEGIVKMMLQRYPDLGNPYTLWVAAVGQRDEVVSAA